MKPQIWLIDFSKFDRQDMETCFSILPEKDGKLIEDLYPSFSVLAQSLVRNLALRHFISQFIGLSFDQIEFKRNEYGKLSIVNPDGEEIVFSLSHANGFLALLVGKKQGGLIDVGIDLEAKSRSQQVLNLAEQFMSKDERQSLQSLEDEEKKTRALQLWTLKESISKAEGLGLLMDFREFNIEVNNSYSPQLRDSKGKNFWCLGSLNTNTSLHLAFCLKSSLNVFDQPVHYKSMNLEFLFDELREPGVRKAG